MIDHLRLGVDEPVNEQFSTTNTLFSVVELVTNMDSLFVSQLFQPLYRDLYGTFRFKLISCKAPCIAAGGHILHDGPKVQGIALDKMRSFFHRLEERNDIQIIAPDEKLFKGDHLVFLPHLLTVLVLFS